MQSFQQASVRLPAGMVGSPSAIRPQASAVRAAPKLTGAIRSRRRSFAAAESVSNHSVITNAPSNLPTAPKMNKDRPAAAATTDRAGAAAAAAALAALMLTAQPSIAADAASTFANRCAGCHAGGGNVTQAGASLKTGDLERNGYGSPEAIYNLIYAGKGKMPGFGEGCTPKGKCTFAARLSDEEVQAQVDYVLQQAAAGWK